MDINKIYFYKLTTDNGGAPCVQDSILSLAICKPKIRATAKKGDWIIGFGGKDLNQRLIYVAEVTDVIDNYEYYKKQEYFYRDDCIYRFDKNDKPEWKKRKKYHQEGEFLKHDLGEKKVLLSNNYTYFGKYGTTEYKVSYKNIKNVVELLRQGHRVNHTQELFDELADLIKKSISKKVKGIPSQKEYQRTCNQIEGVLIKSCKSKC